jgi:signal transduction histidine kinase
MAWVDIAMEVGKDLPTVEQLTKVQESAQILERQLEFAAEYQEMGLKQPQWIDLEAAASAGVEGLDLAAVSLDLDLKGAEIFADPMLEKVFHNLVDNSLRYGDKLTQIRLHCEESGGRLTVICEDDGVGVPVDEKAKIFLRGYGKHTGLGLYLVREILDITGIAVKETGGPNKGARFELLVPSGHYRICLGGQ